MEVDFKAIILIESDYIDLSERLRNELELKIDKLNVQDHFNNCDNPKFVRIENMPKSDFLCAYHLSKASKKCVLSGELLQGIKTWFNMYYDDRLSVIDKFRTCYQNAIPPRNLNDKSVLTTTFCKFLLSELLGILAESRWRDLVQLTTDDRQMK